MEGAESQHRELSVTSSGAGQHVLAIGYGTGLLALLAESAGAQHITCVEETPMLYRMTKQLLKANAKPASVKLCSCPLVATRAESEGWAFVFFDTKLHLLLNFEASCLDYRFRWWNEMRPTTGKIFWPSSAIEGHEYLILPHWASDIPTAIVVIPLFQLVITYACRLCNSLRRTKKKLEHRPPMGSSCKMMHQITLFLAKLI